MFEKVEEVKRRLYLYMKKKNIQGIEKKNLNPGVFFYANK